MIDLQKLPILAKAAKKQHAKILRVFGKKRKSEVDSIIHHLHDEQFAKINCLDCANCCITTGPLLTSRDISQISKYLGQKEGEFSYSYLRVDEDNDHVFKKMPCPFLGEANYCSIYDVRPKACREYPHTDRKNQVQLFHLTLKNAEICPAVFQILNELIPKG